MEEIDLGFDDLYGPAARPFLKWAGGKIWALKHIIPHIPAVFNRYFEPFLGAGAVFFAIRNQVDTALLSDWSEELISIWKAVQQNPRQLHSLLEEHWQKHNTDPDHYYTTRAADPDPCIVAEGARWLYINWACFNGLHRVNSTGGFNTSKGKPPPGGKRPYPNLAELCAVQETLNPFEISIEHCRFRTISPEPGDLIYCDPPYYGGYNEYTADRFDEKDQQQLARKAERWLQQGCYVILSNSKHPQVDKLYPDSSWIRKKVAVKTTIAPRSNRRGYRTEYIIYPRKEWEPLKLL